MAHAARPAVLIVALWAAGLGAAAQFGKISVTFDALVGVYGGTGRVALMVSIVGLVGLVLGTTAGIVAYRLGLRRTLLGALVAGALLSAFQATLPAYPLMMASRVIEGLSHLAIVVIGPVMIAQAAPARHQALGMSLWSSFFGLSYAALAFFGVPFAAAHGVGGLFLVHGGYLLVMASVLALLLPRDGALVRQQLSFAAILREHRMIYASPVIAAPATGFFFYTLIYIAVLTLVPPMMGAQRVVAATAMPLVSIGVSLTFGVWLLRRVPAVRLVQAGFAAALAGACLMAALWGIPPLRLAAAMLFAAALGLVQGASFAAIPQLNPSAADRARAAGAVAQLGNLGTTSGTPLLAMLAATFGVGGVAGFVVPLCLGGIAIHAVQAARRRGAASASEAIG